MELIVKNIKILAQVEDTIKKTVSGPSIKTVPTIEDAWLYVKDGLIEDFGKMEEFPSDLLNLESVDASDRIVLPAWVDSHTHLVFAGTRESEFVDKINGLSYAEIAKRGGGILNSAGRLQQTSEQELLEQTLVRAEQIMSMGTGTVEIKSGYGLTLKDELKMLRVAKRVGEETALNVKTTFLGAHAVPKNYSKEDYLDLVIKDMIPQVAEEKLAEYCDVFCEDGFFSQDETERVLKAALEYGLKPKVHANQLNFSGGVQVGVKCGAVSVDHLESSGDEEIKVLKGSNTIPTLLPGAAFFIRTSYPPARDMIEAGLPVALATDFNPGSSPTGNMNFMMSLACVQMRMTPQEAINAATINAAAALEMSHEVGSIARGKKADFIITEKIPSLDFIPYNYAHNPVYNLYLKGEKVIQNER
ncbi:imidazolonepropionase [Marinigracilibium pacificum]|uniref:Imidazolonepropionase n=1 Tax=Marinigracilibium pacificum TaxID=2729599 RepID=A0A848J3E0_9BACT|nr:imidazolonepropionase [Marinigracilibium pacificum]NMM50256.1 imidazolonepropionase [Marinigracilibium pacificum]